MRPWVRAARLLCLVSLTFGGAGALEAWLNGVEWHHALAQGVDWATVSSAVSAFFVVLVAAITEDP